MKIALLGYGRMGHEIEQVAGERGHQVVLIVDKDNLSEFTFENTREIDAVIEFTGPDSAPDIVRKALSFGLPVVSGSTGWQERYDEITAFCSERNGSFIHSSNYSIGVNILFRLNADLARIMSTHADYKVTIQEIHHIRKLDSPSGTAITLAREIEKHHPDYDGWKEAEANLTPKHIPVEAVREGSVPGIHSVVWDSDIDVITIRHEAKNRRGFARGAVTAAEYIAGRTGVFTMTDVLGL